MLHASGIISLIYEDIHSRVSRAPILSFSLLHPNHSNFTNCLSEWSCVVFLLVRDYHKVFRCHFVRVNVHYIESFTAKLLYVHFLP